VRDTKSIDSKRTDIVKVHEFQCLFNTNQILIVLRVSRNYMLIVRVCILRETDLLNTK